MLDIEFVKGVYNSVEIDPRIKAAREMSAKLLLHVDGIGLQDALARINNYENEKQFDARKKHAISNKFITEELLRPVDNAFHARGGSKNYQFKSEGKEDELIKELVNIKSNLSLSEYIEQEWFHRFITDPNGLIFMEIESEEENSEQSTIEPTYKSIESIRAYKQNGIFVDWVIFEPHLFIIDKDNPKDKTKQKERFWVVDEKSYYLYQCDNEGITLIEEVPNSFEKVPAILCSNIVDNVTRWKRSAIDAQVELLDKYMVSSSVLNIAEFLHNYPREWAYVDTCAKCNGAKFISDDKGGEMACNSCDGTGKATKKDVTDVDELRIPRKDDAKIDPPRGYTYVPIDAWTSQTNSVDRQWDLIYFTQWGTTVSKDTKNETATGRFLDAQPVNNRLNKYSKSIEQAHTQIAQFIGEFHFPETFERVIIQYGRRYLIETPDQIWEKYIESKEKNAPVSILDLLLSQFLESEFRENERLFIYEMKKVKLEPFVHWDIVKVKGLNVDPIDYNKKLYFSDWIQTKEVNEIIETDIEKLNGELTDFAKKKAESQNKGDE